MEAYYAEFPLDGRPVDRHEHGSAEFIYVISGRLVVDVNGEETALDTGDAIYFDPSVPHGYRREGKVVCRVLVVVIP